MDAQPQVVTAKRAPLWRRFLPLSLLLAGLVLFYVLRLDRYLDFEILRDYREDLLILARDNRLLGPAMLAAVYAVVAACGVPGAWILTVAAGFLFGTLVGGMATVVGATLGASMLFLAARYALSDLLRARFARWLGPVEAGFHRGEVSYLLLIRLVPLVPFNVANILPALLDARFRIFLPTTFFGIMPGAFIYASIGAGLGAIFEAGGTPEFSGIFFESEVFFPVLGLILLSLLPLVLRRAGMLPAAADKKDL